MRLTFSRRMSLQTQYWASQLMNTLGAQILKVQYGIWGTNYISNSFQIRVTYFYKV